MAESFDAALVELRRNAGKFHTRIATRLQSAHEAEVAELRKQLQFWKDSSDDVHNLWQEDKDRADRAVGLLRECEDAVFGKELWERIRAFLSEQAGERENGDG